eukprot:6114929-Amphidinium_carterae.1
MVEDTAKLGNPARSTSLSVFTHATDGGLTGRVFPPVVLDRDAPPQSLALHRKVSPPLSEVTHSVESEEQQRAFRGGHGFLDK